LIKELYNPNKLIGLSNNLYSKIVLQNALKYLSNVEKNVLRDYLLSTVNITSKKDRVKIIKVFDFYY
jgi:hypothetical protein